MDNPIFKDDGLYKCFTYCLLKANHRESEFLIRDKLVKCLPGEFIIGRHEANKDLGWKSHRWDDKISLLSKHGFTDKQTDKHFTKIKIINWHIYQGDENGVGQENGQATDNRRTSDGQVTDTNKNVKNVKNVKKRNILPDDEWILKIKSLYYWVDWDVENRKMDAWLLDNPHRTKTRAFIKNWLNKKQKDKPILKTSPQPEKHHNEEAPQWIKEAVSQGWKI